MQAPHQSDHHRHAILPFVSQRTTRSHNYDHNNKENCDPTILPLLLSLSSSPTLHQSTHNNLQQQRIGFSPIQQRRRLHNHHHAHIGCVIRRIKNRIPLQELRSNHNDNTNDGDYVVSNVRDIEDDTTQGRRTLRRRRETMSTTSSREASSSLCQRVHNSERIFLR